MKPTFRLFLRYLSYYIAPAVLLILAVFPILSVRDSYDFFAIIGRWSLNVFTFIMVISPLSVIFGKVKYIGKFLKKSFTYRKELGLLVFWLAFFHSIYLFIVLKMNLLPINRLFSFSGYISWGIYAFIAMVILGATSNKISMIKLKTNWKKIQMLAYPTYAAVCVHTAIVKNESGPYVLLGVYIILKITQLIILKKRKSVRKKNDKSNSCN